MKIHYSYKTDEDKYRLSVSETATVTATDDYEKLKNKPVINTVELVGSISLPELGLRAIYYDTTANWDAQASLIAEEGVIYIYSDYQDYTDEAGNVTKLAGIKIGDGSAYLVDVPFVTEATTSMVLSHINNTDIHITPAERAFWNNKVAAYEDLENPENLILSTTNYMLNGQIISG